MNGSGDGTEKNQLLIEWDEKGKGEKSKRPKNWNRRKGKRVTENIAHLGKRTSQSFRESSGGGCAANINLLGERRKVFWGKKNVKMSFLLWDLSHA